VAEGVPRVLIGDAQRLQQILLNVLNNAVKFTETGGILLEVWVGPAPPRADAATRADAGAAVPARPGAADDAAADGAARRAVAAELAADVAALAAGTGGTVDTGATRTQLAGGDGSDMPAGACAPRALGAGGHAPAERTGADRSGAGAEAGAHEPARGESEPRGAAAAGADAGACREGGCWGPCAIRIPDAGSAARDSGGSFAEWLGQPRAEAGPGSPASLAQNAAGPRAPSSERGAGAAPCSPGRGGLPAGCAPAPKSPRSPEGPPAPGPRRSLEGGFGGGRGGPDAGPLLDVHFSVRDTCIGISRADLDLLFRSFSQARAALPQCAAPAATRVRGRWLTSPATPSLVRTYRQALPFQVRGAGCSRAAISACCACFVRAACKRACACGRATPLGTRAECNFSYVVTPRHLSVWEVAAQCHLPCF